MNRKTVLTSVVVMFVILVIFAYNINKYSYEIAHYFYVLRLSPKLIYDENDSVIFMHKLLEDDLTGMKTMINHGYDINSSGKNGITPLYFAMINAKKKAFIFLLDNGANPDVFVYEPVNMCRYTSLLGLSLEYDDIYYFNALVLSGANLYISCYQDYDLWVIDTAIVYDRLIAFKLFDEKGVNFEGYVSNTGNYYDCVGEAAVSNCYDIVYYLLQKGVNYKHLGPYGHGLHFTMMRENFNRMSEYQEQYYQLCLNYLKRVDDGFKDIPDRY